MSPKSVSIGLQSLSDRPSTSSSWNFWLHLTERIIAVICICESPRAILMSAARSKWGRWVFLFISIVTDDRKIIQRSTKLTRPQVCISSFSLIADFSSAVRREWEIRTSTNKHTKVCCENKHRSVLFINPRYSQMLIFSVLRWCLLIAAFEVMDVGEGGNSQGLIALLLFSLIITVQRSPPECYKLSNYKDIQLADCWEMFLFYLRQSRVTELPSTSAIRAGLNFPSTSSQTHRTVRAFAMSSYLISSTARA